MTDKTVKKKAFDTLFKSKCYSLDDCNSVADIIEAEGVTVIDFKRHCNSADLCALIKKLGIEDRIESSDSFLYMKGNLNLLFINSELTDDDRCALLRHELGHIVDPDFKSSDTSRSRIKKEEFANAFSLYTKNPGFLFKLRLFTAKKRKLLTITAVAAAIAVALSLVAINLPTAGGDEVRDTFKSSDEISDTAFCVTSSGKKYHRKGCIVVRYKNNLTELSAEEATEMGYTPCMICNYNTR